MKTTNSTADPEYRRSVYRDEITTIHEPQKAPQKVGTSPVKVGSPAGAGKSTSIVLAVDYYLDQDIASADSIFVAAFNRSVATELKTEFTDQLPNTLPELTIQTLHQQAREILEMGGVASSSIKLGLDFSIADGAKQESIAVKACTRCEVDISPSDLVTVVNRLKATGIRFDPVETGTFGVDRLPVEDPVIDAEELRLPDSVATQLSELQDAVTTATDTLIPADTSADSKAEVLSGLDDIETIVDGFSCGVQPSRSRAEQLLAEQLTMVQKTAHGMESYVQDNWPTGETNPGAAAVPAAVFNANSPTQNLNVDLSDLALSFPVGKEFEEFISELEHLQEWLDAYAAYEDVRKDAGVADFQDLTYYAATAVAQNPDTLQESYDVVVVDEAQDINLMEFWLVSLLGQDRIVFTGDSAQTVNEFRGSDRDLFDHGIDAAYEDVHTDFLKTNYRSRDQLVAFSDRYRGRIQGEHSHGTRAFRSESSKSTDATEEST